MEIISKGLVSALSGVASRVLGDRLSQWLTTTWPDFEASDKRKDFQLYEAACLWFDRKPILPMPRAAKRMYRELKAGVESGGLAGIFTNDALDNALYSAAFRHKIAKPGEDFYPPITPHTKVKRAALLRWAEKRGDKPRFLYPERRGE